MMDKKPIFIGFLIALILVLIMGYILPIGQFIAVLIGATVTEYLANKKTKITVIEAALHGILVGIFTAIAQISVVFIRSGFSETTANILLTAALVLMGAYIIIGALGGITGILINLKPTNSP
ncbi:MAG: DUF5518 domain-containing protein [Methanobacterium sp.]|nr:DUF5518 domain-containing protein [Methanobacterium sp.]